MKCRFFLKIRPDGRARGSLAGWRVIPGQGDRIQVVGPKAPVSHGANAPRLVVLGVPNPTPGHGVRTHLDNDPADVLNQLAFVLSVKQRLPCLLEHTEPAVGPDQSPLSLL